MGQARGLRDDVVILGKGAHPPDCTPEAMQRQLTESLDRLQTDHIDIYCLHRDKPDVPVGEWVDALNGEVQAGRIGLFGGSNWTAARIDAANDYAAANGKQGFALLSNNFSLARMEQPVWPGCVASSENDFRAWHEARNMPLVPWSSQARGFSSIGSVTGCRKPAILLTRIMLNYSASGCRRIIWNAAAAPLNWRRAIRSSRYKSPWLSCCTNPFLFPNHRAAQSHAIA